MAPVVTVVVVGPLAAVAATGADDQRWELRQRHGLPETTAQVRSSGEPHRVFRQIGEHGRHPLRE